LKFVRLLKAKLTPTKMTEYGNRSMTEAESIELALKLSEYPSNDVEKSVIDVDLMEAMRLSMLAFIRNTESGEADITDDDLVKIALKLSEDSSNDDKENDEELMNAMILSVSESTQNIKSGKAKQVNEFVPSIIVPTKTHHVSASMISRNHGITPHEAESLVKVHGANSENIIILLKEIASANKIHPGVIINSAYCVNWDLNIVLKSYLTDVC